MKLNVIRILVILAKTTQSKLSLQKMRNFQDKQSLMF